MSLQDTSLDAGASYQASGRGQRDAELIFDLMSIEPCTCWEIEKETGLKHQTASARIRGLVLEGRLVDSGEKRPTESGRCKAIVWKPA